MKQKIIDYLKSEGFEINIHNTTEEQYYMGHINFSMDAQGDDTWCSIRAIGYSDIEEELYIEQIDEDTINRLKKRICEWVDYGYCIVDPRDPERIKELITYLKSLI